MKQEEKRRVEWEGKELDSVGEGRIGKVVKKEGKDKKIGKVVKKEGKDKRGQG